LTMHLTDVRAGSRYQLPAKARNHNWTNGPVPHHGSRNLALRSIRDSNSLSDDQIPTPVTDCKSSVARVHENRVKLLASTGLFNPNSYPSGLVDPRFTASIHVLSSNLLQLFWVQHGRRQYQARAVTAGKQRTKV